MRVVRFWHGKPSCRALVALLAALMCGTALAGWPPPVAGVTPGTFAAGNDRSLSRNTFYAPSYGSCTWDTTHDVGPCIQLAEAAAIAAGGGTVELPAGSYGLATPLLSYTRGVHHRGMGVGDLRDNQVPSVFQAVTRLVWIGTSGATMFSEGPTSTSAQSLYAADVSGIVFDCNNLAAVCAKITQTSHSTIKIGVAESTSIGADLTTNLGADSPGTQDNDVWIDARQTGTQTATGILIDGGAGSNWNVSYNRFWRLHAWYNKGDGIVFGNSDNNLIADLSTYPQPGATGTPVVFAAQGYVPPNGIATTGVPYTTRVLHAGTPITVQGFTQGAALTSSGANTGTAAVTPVSLNTNAAVSGGSQTLPFAAASGVVAGMNVGCGTPASGVVNNDNVVSVAGGTIGLGYPAYAGGVPNGTACIFSFGLAASALVGTYTITATSPTLFNIAGPGGQHGQTGVALSGGVLAFNDVTIPMTGTPAAGDAWTLVVMTPPTNVTVEMIDKANSIPSPHFGIGAIGSFTPTTSPFPVQASALNGINLPFAPEGCNGRIPSVGPFAVNLGNCGGSGATGSYSTVLNGVGGQATGYGAATVGGHNATASGIYAVVTGGENGTAAGVYGRVGGGYSTDRGRYGTDCWASGQSAVQGDAQTCSGLLRASSSTSAAARMTADGASAGSSNTWNIPNNTVYRLRLTLTGWLPSGVKSVGYTGAMRLVRGASASSTLLSNTTLTPDSDNDAITGLTAPSIVSDASLGGINLTSGYATAGTMRWVAKVTSEVEVQ